MNFIQGRVKEFYLLTSEIENIFISEYMPGAPAEYVKVYLYGLMCAQTGQDASPSVIAKQLSSSEEEVRKAFLYWKERGVIRLYKDGDDEGIEFVSLRSMFVYGTRKGGRTQCDKQGKGSGASSSICDATLAELYKNVERALGRPLGAKESVEIISWIDDYGATPELIVKAYSYCREVHKKDAPAYVAKVVKSWALKGLTSVSAIEEYLEENERTRFLYKRVFKALGFARYATEEERRIMDVWFNEMNIPIDQVLEACKKTSGITNPNINYIDKILKNQYKENGGSISGEEEKIPAGVVLKYYDYVRETEEALAKEHAEEVYDKIPEIRELDEQIRRAGSEMSRIMISRAEGKKEAAEELRRRVDSMLAEKAATLTDNGYPADYLEVKRRCKICGDTGTTENGERCECFAKMMEEAKEWQNSLKTKTSFS